LGRLTNVVEPTGASTGYAYDAQDNLRTVNQLGLSGETARARSFVYDSLSRLTSSTNPETGTISYIYDANGNVISKSDARNVTTSFVYDALNRVTSTSYSDGITPNNYYAYDVAPSWMPDLKNVIGRLANSANQFGGGTSGKAAAATYSYDPMGRVIREWVQTPSASPGGYFLYSNYNVAGNVTSLTYPDGRVVNQQWNGAGQLQQVADGSGYLYMIPQSTYWPNGTPQSDLSGHFSGITE
jgi:YD repeat-containing protein